MLRRPPAAALVLALAVIPLLTGCSLLQRIVPHTAPSAGPLTVGSCLDGMVGADSDRTATVACELPHMFEVTGIDEWPGMADALAAADDAGALWDEINGPDAEGHEDYWEWAAKACMASAQRVIGIADVELDGVTAGDLWLRIGGPYNVDHSLATRSDFVGGDHRTVCSLAWYYGTQTPEREANPSFSELLKPDFPTILRECWDAEYYDVPCTRPHNAQAVVIFDGLPALGPALITRTANGEATDDDWSRVDDVCEELMLQALPSTASLDELWYYGETTVGQGWDDYEDAIDEKLQYPYACLAVGENDGDLISGDVFNGDAHVTTASGSGSA
jgi:hypothetical protein